MTIAPPQMEAIMPISYQNGDIGLVGPEPDQESPATTKDAAVVSFLLQVHNTSALTAELITRLNEVMAKSGLDVTLTPALSLAGHTGMGAIVDEAHGGGPIFLSDAQFRDFAEGLVLTDVQMPDIAGALALKQIRLTTAQIESRALSPRHTLAAFRGEAQLVKWTEDGTLLDGSKIQQAWGVTRQAVDAARERGEVFSIWAKRQHWYPAEALKFKREDLAAITRALGDIDPSSKLLFLLHKHGAVGGVTPAEAVADKKLDDILRLAALWGRT
ncbi:response regulator [Duganella vulcania]|uniref:Uncharacterized protein n=1 Tax=Duganella vulcania TaxID=2692166 RepID=A0A845GIT5_9BURK|nr:response regulator [Duganella vulcania]MYM92667.1 hypothetical protein [Duganella vulcania]